MRIRLVFRRLRFRNQTGRQHSFVETDHEIVSMVILFLLLFQEGQLSVSGESVRFRGLSLPGKGVVSLTNRVQHGPIGLTGP